jgi:hypothetical protein
MPWFLDQLPLQEFISMYLADIPRKEFHEGIQVVSLVEDLNAFGVLLPALSLSSETLH